MIWKSGLGYLGTPYIWGGNDINKGVDCSALICFLLRENKLLDIKDYSAQMLFDKFRGEFISPKSDALLFFGKDFQNISHIAIAIDEKFMLEAGGEGRVPSDKGSVRIKRIKNRHDLLCAMEIHKQD